MLPRQAVLMEPLAHVMSFPVIRPDFAGPVPPEDLSLEVEQLGLVLAVLGPLSYIPDLSSWHDLSCSQCPDIGLPQAGDRVWSAAGGGWCSFLLITQADWWPTFFVGSMMVVKLVITPQAGSLGARGSHGSRV